MKYPIDTNRYIESTRVLYGAKGEMEQARRDAERFGDGLPAVFHRRSREGWRVTMALPDWLEVYRKLPTKKGD